MRGQKRKKTLFFITLTLALSHRESMCVITVFIILS